MRALNIDFNLLVPLDAILQTASVMRAAAQVGLSKPAMSHALARLRRQVGDEILVRSGQQWILSETARALAPRVHALVEEARELMTPRPAARPEAMQREFRIHTTDLVLCIIGAELGHAISREAPEVRLKFHPVEANDATVLRSGEADLAIGVFTDLPAEFRTQRLFKDHLVCLVRRNGSESPTRLTLERFAAMRHVLVSPTGRPGSPVDDALAKLGKRRRVARAVPFFLSALDLVSRSDDCVVTVSARLAHAHAERFGLRVLTPPLALPPYGVDQVWHPRVHEDRGHQWLRRLIASVARKQVR